MDRQANEAAGGEVIWVDFAARSGRRRAVPTISPAQWVLGARRCEEMARQCEPRVARTLLRVAAAYRAKAGVE